MSRVKKSSLDMKLDEFANSLSASDKLNNSIGHIVLVRPNVRHYER